MNKLLMASYWIGIIADALATVLLFSPNVASFVLQPQLFEMLAVYLYTAGVAGALVFGWTVLLFWAQLKPIERADVLLITLFPVVTLLAVAAGLVAGSNQIPASRLWPMFGLYFTLYCTFLPAFIWAKRQPLHS